MAYNALHIVLNNFLNDSRVLKECKSLYSKLNIKVNVFALHEKGLETYEENDFLSINRFILKTRSWSKKKPIQLIKYFECCYCMYKKAFNLKPDIVHAHDLNALPIGVIIAKKLNIPLIYDAHEYETERNDMKKLSAWRLGSKVVESSFIKSVDKMITVSEGIAKEYVDNYNIEEPTVIINCPYFETVNKYDLFRKEFKIPTDHLIFLYQGGLLSGRGLPQLLEAFKRIQDKSKHLVIMGYGVLEPTVKKYADEVSNIHYKKAVKPEEILKWTSSADIGISTIENTCLSYYYCLPNKLFEYLMAGLPVIVSNLLEQKRIVTQYNLGWVLYNNIYEEIRGLVENIKKEDLNTFSRITQAVNVFNWEEQEKKLINLYSSLLK